MFNSLEISRLLKQNVFTFRVAAPFFFFFASERPPVADGACSKLYERALHSEKRRARLITADDLRPLQQTVETSRELHDARRVFSIVIAKIAVEFWARAKILPVVITMSTKNATIFFFLAESGGGGRKSCKRRQKRARPFWTRRRLQAAIFRRHVRRARAQTQSARLFNGRPNSS